MKPFKTMTTEDAQKALDDFWEEVKKQYGPNRDRLDDEDRVIIGNESQRQCRLRLAQVPARVELWLHACRTSCRDRDHRYPRLTAFARPLTCKSQGARGGLSEQLEAAPTRLDHVR